MDKKNENSDSLEKVVSLCKRRGFIFQGSEIYGGIAGTWDYGPMGVSLKNNLKDFWWKRFVEDREDMYGLDAAILMNRKVWDTSGHTAVFADPVVEDLKTKKRYRADHLLEEIGIDASSMSVEEMDKVLRDKKVKSPEGNDLSQVRKFNMMFKTYVGATQDEDSETFLRPETAQGIFVNFKNIVDSFRPKPPFGIAQIGKAFRNEIAPRDFIFRVREFEQMEIEFFLKEDQWEELFEYWRKEIRVWLESLGLKKENLHELEVPEEDRAHYSKRTVDFEFNYPFGKKELCGLAYRTDYDLKNHMEASKVDLRFSFDEEATKERTVPHVIEPTFGLDRLILAVLSDAYTEDDLGGDKRVFLKLPPQIAPVKAAVFPLLKNKPNLVEKARDVYANLKKTISSVEFDDNGNIGKRYRRQDEIGTPFCVTIDFDTLEDDTVTVRNRDSGEQERVKIEDILSYTKLS